MDSLENKPQIITIVTEDRDNSITSQFHFRTMVLQKLPGFQLLHLQPLTMSENDEINGKKNNYLYFDNLIYP